MDARSAFAGVQDGPVQRALGGSLRDPQGNRRGGRPHFAHQLKNIHGILTDLACWHKGGALDVQPVMDFSRSYHRSEHGRLQELVTKYTEM
jgi:hypothetical protein